LFHVESRGWYVRTTVTSEGPFATYVEALNYLALVEIASAAGVACSWPVPRNKSENERRARKAKIFEIALAGLGWVRRRRRNRAYTIH
jgi:hypothetical protein